MNSQTSNKFPSMTSLHSLASIGYLPPGHGYVPKKQKPDKPYGPNFVTIMNRTWRGPGRKYLNYAMACFCAAIIFYCATALYFGHRNVSRMIVLHTEVMGAIMCIIAILLTGGIMYFIYKARLASNQWRAGVRYRSEGLYMVAAYNQAYAPEDDTPLMTGTYGPRAVKEIPRPARGQKRGRSRAASNTTDGRMGVQQQPPPPGRGMYDRRGMPRPGPPMEVLSEDAESDMISDVMPGYTEPGLRAPYPPHMQAPPGKFRHINDMDEGDSSSTGLPPSYSQVPMTHHMRPLAASPVSPPQPSPTGAKRGSREELDQAPPATPKGFSPPSMPQVHRAAPPQRTTPQPAPPPGGMTYSQIRQGHGVTRGINPVAESDL